MINKVEIFHSLFQKSPILNEKEPISHLIYSLQEVEEIYKKYPYESKKLFYFMKDNLHNLFYENDYVFNFDIKDLEKVLPENSDIIKVSELFYLGLLLEDQPEMINYSFSKEYIILINNKLDNCPIKNSLQNVFVSKMIITLIKYFYQQTEEEKIIQLEVIKKENIELIEIILGKNEVLKQLKYTLDEVLNKNAEEIYLDIIQLLIKNKKMSDFYYMSEIIEDLDLESVYITKYMFEGILKALNEKNDYLNDYKISNNNDLKEDEINFYYVLIKYILKNEAYIYNIPFLKKNYDKIIKLKDFFNLKPNYNIYNKVKYLFELHSDCNSIDDKSDNNIISLKKSDLLNDGFIKDKSNSKLLSSFNSDDLDEQLSKTDKSSFTNKKCAEQILNKVDIILTYDEYNEDVLSYKIKEIKVNNQLLKIQFFNNLLNGIKDETDIVYKNYQRLINFIDDVKECISNSDLNYKPDIILKLEKEEDDEYYFYNKKNKERERDIYNINCVSSFVLKEGEKTKEFKYKDYDILVNGIDGESNGFSYLINELCNDDYEDSKNS